MEVKKVKIPCVESYPRYFIVSLLISDIDLKQHQPSLIRFPTK